MTISLFTRRINWLLLVFIFSAKVLLSQAPNAGISTVPSPTNGTVTICSNSTVVFTSSSTQTTAQSTYNWNFGTGATPQTATGIGPHSVTYSVGVTTNTSATLVVNNMNGQPNSTATRPIAITSITSPLLTLTSSGAGFSTSTTNGLPLFKNCSASGPQLFSFQSNYPNTATQTINWGDGTLSTQANFTGNQITHVFPIGQFTITHSVTVGNCTKTSQYIVFNGSAPVVSVTGSGQTTCLPSPFSISIASNDVPINYSVSFSDGSPLNLFTTGNDTTISHVFNTSSCGVDYFFAPGVPPIQNAFSVSVVAQNFCSNGFPTVFTIGPITASTGPDATFSYSPGSPICQGEEVTFENTSAAGENISSTGCDSTYAFYWKLLQSSGYTLQSGSFGSSNGFIGSSLNYAQWTSGSEELDIVFTAAGTYTMVLYTANSCGVDSMVQLITVNPAATVSFSPVNQTICSGGLTNLITLTSSVPGYTINWEITSSSNVQGATILTGSGVSPTTINPMTLLNTNNAVGTLEISASVGCTNVPPSTHTITVNPIGNITATPIFSFLCSGQTTDIDFTSNLSNTTFSWTATAPVSIQGEANGAGAGINQTLLNTGNTIDTVQYVVSAGNVACPGANVTVLVAVQPNLTINQNADISVCPSTEINPTNYTSTPPGATFTWTNNNTAIGLGSSGTGDVPTWVAPTNTTGNPITGSIQVSAQLNSCPAVQDDFTVTIQSSPTFSHAILPVTGLTCLNDTVTILGNVNPTNSSVSWTGPFIFSGTNTLTPVVTGPGNYTITVTAGTTGCTSQSTVQIDPPTTVSINQVNIQSVSCFGGNNGTISVQTDNSSGLSYAWTPAVSSGAQATGLSTGVYSVLVTNADGCTDDTTVFVAQSTPLNLSVTSLIDSECGEDNGSISVSASGGLGGYTYLWSTGATGSVLNEVDAGSYTITITDNGGCEIDSVVSLDCTPLVPLVVPQFLSPNNDNKNDIWLVENLSFYKDNKVTVYNRWGNVVFESEPYENDWNGCFKGDATQVLPAATYFYVIDTKKKSQDPFTGYIEIQP
jgi:gliding motility-associated-like protein